MGIGIRSSNISANDNIQGMNLVSGSDVIQTTKGNRGLLVTVQSKNLSGSPTTNPGFTITNMDGTTCKIVFPILIIQSAKKIAYLPLQVKSVSNFINANWQDEPQPPNDFNYYVSILK